MVAIVLGFLPLLYYRLMLQYNRRFTRQVIVAIGAKKLFSLLGMLADRAICFACVKFFIFNDFFETIRIYLADFHQIFTNQFYRAKLAKVIHSLLWHYETDFNFAMPIGLLTAVMICYYYGFLHGCYPIYPVSDRSIRLDPIRLDAVT